MDLTPSRLRAALERYPVPRRYWVAYSGGRDSHVLLHALAALGPRPLGAALGAFHVDHGLHPDASRWAEHCRAECARLDVELQCVCVDARPRRGESPEAAARRARYAALSGYLGPGEALLTAHHGDDQAETVLLQLVRGAGPRGLAGMPEARDLGPGRHLRPLLGFTRADLERYARAHGLEWVEDASNADPSFDRSHLRAALMPGLTARWPAAPRTLARAAAHQAESARLIEALGHIDLADVATGDPGRLSVSRLAALTPERQRNVLRTWIDALGLPAPSAVQLERVRADAAASRPDACPRVHWPGVEVRRYRDGLYAMPPLATVEPGLSLEWDMAAPLRLPHGVLEALPGGAGALRRSGSAVTVRLRAGGERCRPEPGRPSRRLKTLFQEHGVPPWERARVPLVFVDGGLAAVAGHWVCAPFQAAAGESGVWLRWRPDGRG